ncbi:hypothetical protein EV715DRAFT_260241 [Schizophyllum commune]
MRCPTCMLTLLLLRFPQVRAYTPAPRWGQATMVVNDALFVHGGKSDEYNQYSYSSAPTNSDLLYLDLSSSFDVSDPPWQLLSTDGPQVAWHTLSALNYSTGFAFGGQPGWTSEPSLVTRSDSAWLLDVYNRTSPQWNQEPTGWADEPMRRMRHTAVTSNEGKVYIIGGERADGSGSTFADNYVFDPAEPSFTPLPTDNAPRNIYGHASVILPNQHILVFGGYAASALVDLNTIWVLDITQDPPVWSTTTVDGSSAPSGRIAFAYVLLDGPKVLIHGGSDQSGQTTMSDGWILDLSGDSWTWTRVDSLSNLGARRDHFAVSAGSGVIFGFGYSDSGPISESPVQVYDPSSGNVGSTYSPPPSSYTQTASATVPVATQTGTGASTATGGGSGGTGTNTGAHPTSTVGGGDDDDGTGNGSGSGNGDGSGSGNGNGDGLPGDGTGEDGGKKTKTTAIAVGTILGFLLCAAAIIVVVWVWRHQRQNAHFRRLNDNDEGGGRLLFDADNARLFDADNARLFDTASNADSTSPTNIPIAGGFAEKGSPRQRGGHASGILASPGIASVLGALGLASVIGAVQRAHSPKRERRDMLADEDTRDFSEWYRSAYGSNYALGGSSYGVGGPGNGSSWSLRTLFGGRMRREASGFSSISTVTGRGEKGDDRDPFGDGASLLRDEETGYVGAAAPGVAGAVAAAGLRPPHSRQTTENSRHTLENPRHTPMGSVGSFGESIYVDPFADPGSATVHEGYAGYGAEKDVADEDAKLLPPRLLPPPGALYTNLPMVYQAHTLSPLSETASRNTPSLDRSSSSHEHGLAPFDTASSRLSSSSYSHLGSPRATSIINANPPPSQPLRRSDTWWARFARTPLLDRRGSIASRRNTAVLEDIRDPNPPPRLVAIEESQHSTSPPDESPPSHRGGSKGSRGDSKGSRGGSKGSAAGVRRLYGSHGKSASSLHTQGTLDSAAIEHMGMMDVAQRVRTGSHQTRDSSLSYDTEDGASLAEDGRWLASRGEQDAEVIASPTALNAPPNIVTSPTVVTSPTMITSPTAVTSPIAIAAAIRSPSPNSLPPSMTTKSGSNGSGDSSFPPPPPPPKRSSGSGGGVAARVRDYERRMSQAADFPPPPTNTRAREERSKPPAVDYGLVPRRSLFVANPDHGKKGSGDS